MTHRPDRCRQLVRVAILAFAALAAAAPARASSEGSDVEIGGYGAGPGQMADLRDIVFDGKGLLYVLEGLWRNDKGEIGGNGRVQVLDQSGKPLRRFPVRDDSLGADQDPQRIAVAKDGTIYVTQPRVGVVQRFTADGKPQKPIALPFAMAITALADGRVAVLPNLHSIVNGAWAHQGGERIEIIDAKGAVGKPVALERRLTGVSDMAVDKAGNFLVIADTNQLYRFDHDGKLLTVIGAGAMTRNDDGSELIHSVAVDSTGAIYTYTWGNPGLLVRFSPDLKKVITRPGQFAWADPWSVHSEYTPIAIDPSDRLWVGTSHIADNRHRPSPCVLRTYKEFFQPSGNGAIERSALALALKASIDPGLPSGVAYDLKPIPLTFVVAPANRRVKSVTVDWRIVDHERRELGNGTFDLALEDGVEARHRFEYAPKEYGWCMAIADIRAEGETIARTTVFFGVTRRYPGMIALEADTPMFGPQNPMRAAFAGVPNVRLHAVPDKEHLDGLEAQIAVTEKSGATFFVQITDRPQCAPENVRMCVERFKGRVPVWEITNEPNFTFGSPAEYVATLREAAKVIREVDPKAKIMGPDVCGMDLGWYDAFYAAGGGELVDILSLHDYEGHSTIDPTHWRWKFARLREIMAKHGDGDKPIWQTERAIEAVRGENFIGGAQAVRMTLHRDLLASLGVPSEHNNHFYCDDHGFGDCPSWLWSGAGPHSAVFALRTRQAMVGGRTCTPLDFGRHGNDLFIGLRYDADDDTYDGTHDSVIVVRNLGMRPTPLRFAVGGGTVGGASVEVVDAFGNARRETIVDGGLTLPIAQMATYIRLAKGQSFAAPTLDFGRNQAERARIVYSGTVEGDMALLTDGILETYFHGDVNGTTEGNAIWKGDLTSSPQTLDLLFDSPRTLDRLVLHGVHADNGFCALLDYDVQWRDAKGAWKTIVEHRTPLAPSEQLMTPGCKYATWLLDDNIGMDAFAPVTTEALRVVALRATHGLMPDDRSRAWGNDIPSKLMLREIEAFGPTSAMTVAATVAKPERDATFADETMTVTVANAGAADAAATLRVTPPKGWTATPATAPVKVPAKGSTTTTVKLKPPAALPVGRAAIDVAVLDDADHQLDIGWTTIAIASPVQLVPQPPPAVDAKAQPMAIAITDRASRPVSGVARLDLIGPEKLAPIEQRFGPIAAGASATVQVTVPRLDVVGGRWRARWSVEVDGLVATAEQDLAVRVWNVLGVFPNDFEKEFGPEHGVDLAKVTRDQAGNEQRWRAICANSDGYLDLVRPFDRHEQVCAYAVAYVKAAKAGPAVLSIGTDDGDKLWLNRALVHQDNGAHGASPGMAKIAVKLERGWNEILFKVTQGIGGWGLYCELLDAAGKPMTDVTWAPRRD